MGSTATVYSPTGVQTSPLLPQSSAEHEHCQTEPNPIISPPALSGQAPGGHGNVVISTAGSTTPGGSGVNATREHQSSSPTGEHATVTVLVLLLLMRALTILVCCVHVVPVYIAKV